VHRTAEQRLARGIGATEVAAVAGSFFEFAKLLPVKVNGGKPSSKVTSIRP
jgi:hypothetical protein